MKLESVDSLLIRDGSMDVLADNQSNWLKPQTCEDAISRQDVCELIEKMMMSLSEDAYNKLYNGVDRLPSVKPIRPKGHWITQWNVAHQKEYYYCSECREEFSYDSETGIKMNNYDFCPNCGADMREEAEK